MKEVLIWICIHIHLKYSNIFQILAKQIWKYPQDSNCTQMTISQRKRKKKKISQRLEAKWDSMAQDNTAQGLKTGTCTSCLCRGVASWSNWESWVGAGEWAGTRGVRGEECRNKVRCRDRMAQGKSFRGQAGRQTAELDFASCYHAKLKNHLETTSQ